MKRLVIFGMFVAIMVTTPTDAFFGREKIRAITNEEEEVIKDFLGIKKRGGGVVIPAPEPYVSPFWAFSSVLDEEMNSQEAPGLTYGIYILNAVNEMKMVESVWTQEYKHRASKFFNAMLEMNTGWSSLATGLTKKFLSGLLSQPYSTCAGTLFLSYDITQAGISISKLKELLTNNSLWYYLENRSFYSQKEVWEAISTTAGFASQDYHIPGKGLFESKDEYRKKLNELEKYFERLWKVYGKHFTKEGLSEEFKQQQREKLNKLLIEAIEDSYVPGVLPLPLPTWEEILPEELEFKDGLATALVMDKSGSMSGEKIKRAKEAAYIYVNTSTKQQDMVSLTAFSSNAESITEPISIAEGRELLKKDILSLSASGSTNIGSGLTIALSHLSSCNLESKKAFLMSDGQHNTGTYKPEVAEFQNRGWPIWTMAFGRNADQEMLRWIAEQTGGMFLQANLSNIGSGYHKVNVQAHNGSVFRSYNDFIRTGEKLAYDIPVEPDMKKVGFFTNWQGSRMETILFTPSKTVINRSNISNWGRFVEGETHSCYEIDNPQCGSWQALITGYELPPKGEQINFHSFCQSDIFSNILSFQPNYSRNQEVQVGVKLAEVINGRLSPLRGAQVAAEIKKPSLSLNKFTSDFKRKRLQPATLFEIFREVSGRAQKITLFDDGLHQDVLPGDGIYANTYTDITINGPYLVTIDCQSHTSQGMPIKRTLQESFQVGPIEQNSFTVSDFLDLVNQRGVGRQTPIYSPVYIPKSTPKRTKGQEAQKLVETLLDQLLKKKR